MSKISKHLVKIILYCKNPRFYYATVKIKNLLVFSTQITVTVMSERTKIDSSTKLKIVKLRQENLTMQQIADEVKCSKSAICRILKRYNDTGSPINKK